jgi:lysophospholipase L1-like esterase
VTVSKGRHTPLSKKLLFVFVACVLSILVLEGCLRAYVAITDHFRQVDEATLNSYEMVHPQNNKLRILRPGYKITVSDLVEEKRREGKELGAALIEEGAREYGYGPDDIIFQINKFGFKGPDIEKPKDPNTVRIMAIGDSATYGFYYDRYSYPRALEQYLRSQTISAEVINAGVGGYTTKDVLYRLDYLSSFQPDLAIIYIGWNNIYSDTFLPWSYIILALNKVYRIFTPEKSDIQIEGGRLNISDHYYRKQTGEAIRYSSSYKPTFFTDVEKIIERLSEKGIQPVLVTLPGLFSTDMEPTEEALRIGHLPGNIKNAFVLAVMANRYNSAIRLLAAEENIPLIDLEEWGRKVLVPPEQWFSDSVHLLPEGQVALGNYIGQRLLELNLVPSTR